MHTYALLLNLAGVTHAPERFDEGYFQERVQEITGALLDEMAAGPPGRDLLGAFAFPLPITVICELLGVPVAELARAAAAQASGGRVAVMCSESAWQHCHRRLLADFAQEARGAGVRHLAHDGALARHVPSDGLRLRADGLLVYDHGQSSPL